MIKKSEECSDLINSYYNGISEYPLLSVEEERRLLKNFQTARGIAKVKIREKLVTSNLRLVVKIAKDYQGCGVPLGDLINEGNIGLMKSIDKYKIDKGTKLSYYSSFWIKQSIFRALTNKSRIIRLPCGAYDEYTKIVKFKERFFESDGRDPVIAEISQELGIKECRISIILNSVFPPKSLDEPMRNSEGREDKTYSEVIEDEKSSNIESLTFLKEDIENLKIFLERLPERECRILKYRFGLEGNDEETLERIGKRYNLTRERIRQIEVIALRKLRLMFDKHKKVGDKEMTKNL